MNKKIIWYIVAIIIVIIFIILGVVYKKKPSNLSSNQPITIGAALSLSGDAAQDGESIKNGLELAKLDLKKEGINVDILYQDDKTDGKDTVNAIQALSIQGAEAIIGPTWSFLADAGIPVADRLRIVTVMPANTSEYVGAKSPYAFFTTTKVQKLIPALTDWFKKSNKKKIAIIRNQGAWYETVEKAVDAAVSDAGAQIVFKDTLIFGQEASALPTILAKVKSSGADLIFAEIDSEQGIVVMLKKIQDLRITADFLSVTTSISRVLNSSAANISGINHFYVAAPKNSSAFEEKYQSVYKKKPQAYADNAYDSLMLLVDAIRDKGTMSLADYLKTKTNYKGFANVYKFDENGDIFGGEWVIKTLR